MALIICGINHLTAPIDIRERVAFAPEQTPTALLALKDELGLEEVAILSTCNRTEIYVSGDTQGEELLPWLAGYHQVDPVLLAANSYIYADQDAIRHMMKVASGLDSLVLGEPQILGQVKSAYAVGRDSGTVCTYLNHAFQQAFLIAKRVRTETAIGQNPVSVAYAAVSLSQQIFADLSKTHALLIGAGETIELVAQHLREKRIGAITVANRTLSRAAELAETFDAQAILLSEIPDYLPRADMVISSTASQLPVLGKGAVESALKKRKHRPMFMLDIAVPRDIEPEVAGLDDVYLSTVAALKGVIEENMRHRASAASLAEKIVEEGVSDWHKQLRGLKAVGTIRAFRHSVEQIRDAELDRAIRALEKGQPSEAVLRALAHGLTNKLLHTPTTRLKQAGEEGREEPIRWTHELFDLKHEDQGHQ